MTDGPERIWVCPQYEEKAFHDFEFGGWPEYVRADDAKAAIATARAEALEEAAVKAEREGVYPELNVWDGGPDWYKHGKRIAAAIRALKEKPNG